MSELTERECYICGRKKTALNYRSRCLTCVTQSDDFNRRENEQLRHELATQQAINNALVKEIRNSKGDL